MIHVVFAEIKQPGKNIIPHHKLSYIYRRVYVLYLYVIFTTDRPLIAKRLKVYLHPEDPRRRRMSEACFVRHFLPRFPVPASRGLSKRKGSRDHKGMILSSVLIHVCMHNMEINYKHITYN